MNRRSYVGKDNPFYGKHHSEETKEKIRQNNHLGVHPNKKTRKKLSEKSKGINNPMFGKHHSIETRLKISDSKSGVLNRTYDIKFEELFDKIKHNEIINGILLSDGHMTNLKKGHSMMALEQAKVNEELCFVFKKEMERLGFRCGLLTRSRFRKKNDSSTKLLHSIRVTTEANYCFSLFRQRWYQNGKKIIPSDMMLTGKTLAYWFMGDGSSYKNKKGRVNVDLATCCFEKDDVNMLIEKLQNLGIGKARIDTRNYIRISTKEEVVNFMNMVKLYVLPCFDYKIKFPGMIKK